MNILFITLLDLENLDSKGIYHDLVNELAKRGHYITVVCPTESRYGDSTKLLKKNNIKILKVRVGDITKTSKVKKGINTLRIENQYEKAINRFLTNSNFDLIIYTTPPITFNNLIKRLKDRYSAKSYLLLKDIFPQNAVDLNMFSSNGFIYKFFRLKEKKLYKISDFIGAMSQQNINYLCENNDISAKTHIFRNAIYQETFEDIDIQIVKEKYDLNPDKKLLLYGGNLGIPQGIEYIKDIIKRFHEIENAQLMIVGNGTHYDDLKRCIEQTQNEDIKIHNYLPKEQYNELIAASDIGLIFLDHRFTIPNYPSRLTSLINAGKPILAATDKNTDIKDDIINNQIGLWNESNDVDAFINNANKLLKSDLKVYSENAKNFFDSEFRIEDNIDKLLNIIKE
ncbi:glycosyltransferase family 4 protein [Macrococcoides caseolyticum]|uniref:glycosyltransferase family 4 protein n=3 Tax=Macrococcoides caseolyticum TaxID=69966 RepID=UPI000EEB5C34|nr:glycosyltransferase family 4 protein [Macrococcus caseolyticus]QPT47526.1 glycosyltransferase family 4 protein [Macrococcus caseolyticus]HCD18766.1 glycosyltransferase WbuB [Macrococcus caseolyticus]